MTLDVLTAILQGLPTTLALTFGGLAIGMVGGVPLMLARTYGPLPVRLAARAVIELLRGIPPIVWLFIIAFGLGTSIIRLDPLAAAIIGLGAISCAYMAEIYRGGIAAVHVGQWEASSALGMGRVDTMSRVVGPQVVRVSVPAAATYGIGLLKDSSVAFTIGVSELTFFATQQSRLVTDGIGPFVVVAAVYVVLTVLAAWGARSLDATLRKRVSR